MGWSPGHVNPKDYKIGICHFSAKHAALMSKSKDSRYPASYVEQRLQVPSILCRAKHNRHWSNMDCTVDTQQEIHPKCSVFAFLYVN